jgi:hypothetical protein
MSRVTLPFERTDVRKDSGRCLLNLALASDGAPYCGALG